MYFVYVIKNLENDELYIGYTNNLERRFQEHKQNFSKDKIIYHEAYLYEKDARDRERKLKYYGSAWRALKKRINA
jgi:putative endonuclease